MRPRPKGILGVFRETFQSWSEDKVPRLAAALSYYTIFSIAPLLVVVIAITGLIIGNNAAIRSQILAQVQQLVGRQGAQIVDTLITNTSRPREGLIASAIGVVTLILGATGVFNQLKDALNTIWEVAPKKDRGIQGVFQDRLSGFVMILGLGFLLLVSLVVSTALSVLNQYFSSRLGNIGPISLVANYLIQIVLITFIFAAIFKGLPDVDVQWSEVWVGALVTTILFLLGQYLISLYFTKASPASTYGAAGSLVVILLWVYYSSQILFFGAEFTKAYHLARGFEIVPNENARYLMPEDRVHQGITRPEDEAQPEQAPALQTPPRSMPDQSAPARSAPAATQGALPIPISGPADDQPADDRLIDAGLFSDTDMEDE